MQFFDLKKPVVDLYAVKSLTKKGVTMQLPQTLPHKVTLSIHA